jgi:hypothetical protein
MFSDVSPFSVCFEKLTNFWTVFCLEGNFLAESSENSHGTFFKLQMQNQWENNNKEWQTRVRAMSREFQKRTEGVQYTIFEAMQTVMDYLEDTFEPVLLTPSPGMPFS